MDAEVKMNLRLLDMAHSLALTELIKFILIEVASAGDGRAFRSRLRKIEERVVADLSDRRHFPAIADPEETVIREAACGFVTRFIGSIPTPGGSKR